MDLRERLQAALGETYVLQRELTGGGMARVFLAEERAFGRQVVIKVLSPEMAEGVSAERFTREVRLAAKLQHPNIVPLLTAGTADGIPFYTMPYIEGESLRGRMGAGFLPINTVVNILRDVTRALAYAHAHGVVHRDIKPANVLITGDAAVVTDFGVAKAIVRAKAASGSSDDEALSQAGSAIGTLVYMAPEQAAGDPASDLRADIYSLGIMAYELLTGRTPFAGSTPQQQLLGKMSAVPLEVTELRADTPSSLAELVMRCVRTDPADRPQTASEVAAALENVRNDLKLTRATIRRRRLAIGTVTGMIAVGAVIVATRTFEDRLLESPLPGKVMAEQRRVLVRDFEGGTDTSLTHTVTQLFRVALGQSPSLITVDPASLGPTLQKMNRPDRSVIDAATARELALREGMAAVVEGKILAGRSSYVLSATLIEPHTGKILASADETASRDEDLIPAVGRLSSSLRNNLGESMKAVRETPPLERVTTTSLEALRKYTAAMIADFAQDNATGTALLREAIALDSNFAMAYRKLGNNLYWTRERAQGIEYLRKAYALRNRLTDIERDLLLGTYHSKVTEDFARAKAAFEAVLAVDPDNRVALDNIGFLAKRTGDYHRAEEVFHHIANRWPSALSLSNLADAQDWLGKFAQADSTYRAAIALSKPGGNSAPLSMGLYHFGAARKFDSAAVYLRISAEWPGIDRTKRVTAMLGLATIARVQGRLQDARAILRDAATIENRRGNPGGSLGIELLDVRARWWLLGDAATALRQVDSIRRRVARLPGEDWPAERLAEAYARLGKPEVAREILTTHALRAGEAAAIDLNADSPLAAILADAAGRTGDAIGILRRRSAEPDCKGCFNAEMGFLFDKMGQPDSAIAAFERHLGNYLPDNMSSDSWNLAMIYKRLGELHESRGHTREAADFYGRFVELWNEADPELQPTVREIRRRAAQLSSNARKQNR